MENVQRKSISFDRETLERLQKVRLELMARQIGTVDDPSFTDVVRGATRLALDHHSEEDLDAWEDAIERADPFDRGDDREDGEAGEA